MSNIDCMKYLHRIRFVLSLFRQYFRKDQNSLFQQDNERWRTNAVLKVFFPFPSETCNAVLIDGKDA